MKIMLIICKDCTIDLQPICIVNNFSSLDKAVVAVVILDNMKNEIEFELKWVYKKKEVYTERKRVKSDIESKTHRLMSYLKMAYIENNKMYGEWEIFVFINQNLKFTKNFSVNKLTIGYNSNKDNSSILDIKR